MPDGPATWTFHQYADLFPLMEGDELDALAADIATSGLRHAIVELDGAILDGRNRYRACLKVGVPIRTEKYSGGDPLAYVISANLHRRHLNESQRAMVAATLANMKEGGDHSANLRSGQISQSEAAGMLSVSTRSVVDAKKVRSDSTPEIVRRVERGEVPVSIAAKLADLPRQEQRILAKADLSQLRGAVKKYDRAKKEEELAEQTRAVSKTLGQKFYAVIYADPEWRFEPYSRETGLDRAADNHYQTSELDVIKLRKVPSAKDCVLFLWATVPMLPQALEVMAAWGFSYKSHFVWFKDRIGTGYWSRNKHELLLIGTKGHPPAPAPGEQFESVIQAAVREHSRKPNAFAEMIEEMFPHCDLLEMNARGPRTGWDVWGNEAEEQ